MDTIWKIILGFIEFIADFFWGADLIDEQSTFGKIVITIIVLAIIGFIIYLLVKFIIYLTGGAA